MNIETDRIVAVQRGIAQLAMDSRRHHEEQQKMISVSRMFDKNNEPQDVTVTILPDRGGETVVIPHEIWNLLTAGWEHAAEGAAYFSAANDIVSAFPEVWK